jgi:transketolase
MNNANIKELENKSLWLRRACFEMLLAANQGHPGSILSQIEILISLYYGGIIKYFKNEPYHPEKDKIIISKGHAAMSLYPIFADIGYFEKQELIKFGRSDSMLKLFGNVSIPGIDCTSGSLGHGLGVGCGFAFSAKKRNAKNKTFVILSEGEMYEGSIWESALFASHHSLDNLIVIVDRNRNIILGDTEDCLALEPIKDKWRAFGFHVDEVDGHSISGLIDSFNNFNKTVIKPKVLIANTVKGKGISFMENDSFSHYWKPLSDELIKKARSELTINE